MAGISKRGLYDSSILRVTGHFGCGECRVARSGRPRRRANPGRSGVHESADRCERGQVYKAPRTVDGQPDLQGIWNFSTATPLERPGEYAGKQVLTDEEAAEFAEKDAAKFLNNLTKPADGVGNYNEFWYDGNKRVIDSKRTSLIIDPADGRIPALTPCRAEARRCDRRQPQGDRLARAHTGGLGRGVGPGRPAGALHHGLQFGSAHDAGGVQPECPVVPIAGLRGDSQ